MKLIVQEHGTLVSTFEGVVVFVDNVVLGSCEEFLSWAKERYGYVDMRYTQCNFATQ